MNEATSILREEHDVILRVLDVAEQTAKNLNDGVAVQPAVLKDILEFLKTFADRCHHAKEEDLLFPALERMGMYRDGGPIGVMLMEHTQGRELIREMTSAAEQYAKGRTESGFQWAEAADEYVMLLRAHIDKENNILFVMAERMLRPEDQVRLSAEFKKAEEQKIGAEVVAALRNKAAELAQGESVKITSL